MKQTFKVGDQVSYTYKDNYSFKSYRLFGTHGTVVSHNTQSGLYQVHFTEGEYSCESRELTLIEALPKGTFQSLLEEITSPGVKELIACDCGTTKTHGNLPAEYHSDWCKLHKLKESV